MNEQEPNGEDTMLTIDGKSFRCQCGCNVFKQTKKAPNRYTCNACEAIYEGILKNKIIDKEGE